MLRPVDDKSTEEKDLALSSFIPHPSSLLTWRVSSGSAAVLSLRNIHMDAAPTTAYLMLGERCSRDCAFCTQARASQASAEALSRVTWPAYPADAAADAVAEAFRSGKIARACFQVTVSPDYLETTRQAVMALAERCDIPICASILPRDVEDVATLLEAGAERVTIALDAACERVYRAVKGGSWDRTLALLETCAHRFPRRIGTHLIVGLGETEQEMVARFQELADWGVTIGLFAFTPVAGTALAHRLPPPLAQYRRMQAARWLIVHGLAHAAHFRYDKDDGRLTEFGMTATRLKELLADGEAFRTAGCPACNRPYYNERPGGVLYNYPRPLTPEEAEREIKLLIQE